MRVHSVESLDYPELAPYRTMRMQEQHRKQGVFVIESEKVIRRLLESSFSVISLLLEERWFQSFEPLLKDRKDVDVYVAPKKFLESLTGYSMYQGALALARVPKLLSIEEILKASSRPRVLVAIEGVTNATNMGVIVRSCVAFGVHALITGEASCSPYLRRSVRSSMGAIFHLNVFESSRLLDTLRDLKSEGIRCVAAHPREGSKTIHETDFRTDCCIVFGGEGHGLSDAAVDECTEHVMIPMAGKTDSLNVNTSAAVFLYEVNRQRKSYQQG
jgi:tRNA G18 (ribose-2'-O)-methylase SpoU